MRNSISVGFVIATFVPTMAMCFLLGIIFTSYSPWPQMIVNDRGHAVYQVANAKVQTAVVDVVHKATGLTPFMRIKSGPTDQIVLSDGITVFATNTDMAAPKNVRMFVVNDAGERLQAALGLKNRLVRLGYGDIRLYEPDSLLPAHTMIIVSSPSAFPGNGGVGFRPDGRTMNTLAPDSAKFY